MYLHSVNVFANPTVNDCESTCLFGRNAVVRVRSCGFSCGSETRFSVSQKTEIFKNAVFVRFSRSPRVDLGEVSTHVRDP